MGLIKTQLRRGIISLPVTQGCSTEVFEQENKIKLSVLTRQREWKTTLAVKVEERYRPWCAKGWSNHRKHQAWRNNYSMTDNMLILHCTSKLVKRWEVNAGRKGVSLVYISVLQKMTWMYGDRGVSHTSAHIASKEGTKKLQVTQTSSPRPFRDNIIYTCQVRLPRAENWSANRQCIKLIVLCKAFIQPSLNIWLFSAVNRDNIICKERYGSPWTTAHRALPKAL